MDDRIAEIREALNSPWWRTHKTGDSLDPTRSPINKKAQIIDAAARAYVDLLDSDALIIRRDKIDYEAAVQLNNWTRANRNVVHRIVDAALASSQGVEP